MHIPAVEMPKYPSSSSSVAAADRADNPAKVSGAWANPGGFDGWLRSLGREGSNPKNDIGVRGNGKHRQTAAGPMIQYSRARRGRAQRDGVHANPRQAAVSLAPS